MTTDTFFSSLEKHLENNLPFVVFRKPNQTSVKAYLQQSKELFYTANFEESGFVFSPFNEINDSLIIPESDSELLSLTQVDFNAINTSNSINDSDNTLSEIDQNEHIDLVKQGLEEITNGALKKVVLSRCESIDLPTDYNPLQQYLKLLERYPKAFVYCFFHPKVGLWLGATPETLLNIESNRLTTMSLAGTKTGEGETIRDWTPKELDEQQLVTNYIVKELGGKLSNVSVSETETIQAGKLLHLRTKISGLLNKDEFNMRGIIEALHPTPAVCGLPKQDAFKFILNNENYNRSYYTGFLGEINVKNTRSRNRNRKNVENNVYQAISTCSELFVNLRCLEIKDNKALIYVGGGITKDSNPESEWQETCNKSQTIKFGLF